MRTSAINVVRLAAVAALAATVVIGFGHFGWWLTTTQTQSISGYGHLYDPGGNTTPYYRLALAFRSPEGPFCVDREIDLEVTFALLDMDILDDRSLELRLFGAHLKGNTSGPARISIDVPQHKTDPSTMITHATVTYHQPSVEAGRWATLCVKGRGIATDGNSTGGWVCKDDFFKSDDADFLYVAPLQEKLQERMNRTILVVGIVAVVLAICGIALQSQRRHK